jgi:hypothetical protein
MDLSLRDQTSSIMKHLSEDASRGFARMSHIFAFGVLALASLLTGCAGSPSPPPGEIAGGPAEVAVIGRDWHTEIGVALKDISGPLATFGPAANGARYLIVGFGDRAYFTDHDAGSGTAFAALFPGPAAIQLATSQDLPEDTAHITVRIRLSREALSRIADFIWDSMDRGADGAPLPVVEHSDHSKFYSARQSYDGLYNCNSWTAEALRIGGLPFDPAGVLFASQVMDQARAVAARQTSRAAGP